MWVALDVCRVSLEIWLTLFLTCFRLDMFSLFGCYFVKIYFASEIHGASGFKQILYEGVTVFNVYFSLKFEKKIYDNKCER